MKTKIDIYSSDRVSWVRVTAWTPDGIKTERVEIADGDELEAVIKAWENIEQVTTPIPATTPIIEIEEDKMINRLAQHWGVSLDDAADIIARMDIVRWDPDYPNSIIYGGVIDNGHSDKLNGHNGYWVATSAGEICYVTNGDPVWDTWCDVVAEEIGLSWGDYRTAMEGHKLE
jgi:hypothetical protein